MVETPTFEETMVAFNEAVRFIGSHGLMEQFADEIEDTLSKYCVFNVASYADDSSEEEFARVVSVAADRIASQILPFDDDEEEHEVDV